MCRSALRAVGVISFITISPSITTVSPQPKPVSEKYFAYLNPHNEASVYSYARLDSSRRQWRSNCPWRSFLNRRRQEDCIIHALILQPFASYWACVQQRWREADTGTGRNKMVWLWHGRGAIKQVRRWPISKPSQRTWQSGCFSAALALTGWRGAVVLSSLPYFSQLSAFFLIGRYSSWD